MPALPVVSATMRWYKPGLLHEESLNPGFYRATHDKAGCKQNGLFSRVVSGKTEAGLIVTTRRVVAPKPGLVGHESGGSGNSVDAEDYLSG